MSVNDETQRAGPVLTMPGTPLAFHVMAKPTQLLEAHAAAPDVVVAWQGASPP